MRFLRVALALAPLCCLLGALALYSALVLDVRETYRSGPVTVAARYEYLAASEPLSAQDALTKRFSPVTTTGQHPPAGEQQQWYRVTLDNPTAQAVELVLIVDNPLADLVTVHRVMPDRGAHQLQTLGERGSDLTAGQRALPQLAFSLEPAGEMTLLVHYESRGTSLFPLTVLDAAQFERFSQLRNSSHAAFAGILLLVASCSALLGLWLRDPAYLSYASYGLLVLLSFGITGGFAHYALPAPVAVFFSREIIFVNGLLLVAALEFALFFLRIHLDNRRLYRRAQLYALAVVVGAIASIPAPESVAGRLFTAIHLISYGWVFILLAFRFRERFRWTRYYLLSWIPFFVSTALVSAMFQGLVAYDVLLRFAPLAAVLLGIIFMAAALGERLAMLERRRLHAATHDECLGLPTASAVEARLAALRQAPRDGPVHLLAVEVSNYHAVTPYLAPAEFQAVMLGLASRLQRDLRERVPLLPVEHDGGAEVYVGLPQPEVLVVLLEDRDGTAARAAVETLSREANYNPVPDRVPYQVECRFGLAIGAADGSTDLLGSSRIALSRAEELGLRYWCFSREDVIRGQRKVRLAQDLDRALDQGSLLLYHQPQLSIANPAAVHSEVLLRWQHRSLGFIDPEELVGIAEQTGLITRLTRWVVDESMRHCVLLRQRFGEHCRIAINLSAHDFVGDALLKSLGDGLRQHDLTADCFTLEMTESVRLAVSDATRDTIMQLRQLGFRIAIDDFGTGYAAMSYALNYPVDEIKIDHTFMRDFPDDPRSCKIVASIAGMARELQTTVTVEGVERPLQAHRLTAMACDQLQGYGYARPMPLDAYLSWLDEAAAEARHALLTGNGFH